MTGGNFSPPHDGEVGHFRPGTTLPPVTLPATDGSEVRLAGLPGRTVIAVYPWTGRPGHPNPPGWDEIPRAHGSTPELEGFRDAYPAFTQRGVRIFGLSGQATAYQREMAERLGLPFPVLSDAAGRFGAALALPTFATGGENYLKRLTLISKDGSIEALFYPVLEPARHAGEVLAWLMRLA